MSNDFLNITAESDAAETAPPPVAKSAWTPEKEARILYLTLGTGLIFLVFRKLQTSNTSICCGDYDGYYHIRWSRLLWENFRNGHLWPPKFVWLPLTSLNPEAYVDHHLLFHILQIPFTWFGDLTTGAKTAATIFATLGVLACFWLIVRYRVPHALVWLLALLAASAPFLYRLSMAKAPPLSLMFMVAGIYLLFEEKYKWLMPLGFLYVWTYSLFPTLLAAALFWTLALAWSETRFEWRPLVFASAGVLLGFIVNPYFPKNFVLFFDHLITKTTGFAVAVGNEWYPYDSWELFANSFIAMLAMGVGYVACDLTDRRRRAAKPLFFLLFATLLMIASFRSRRFVEYWPPFAVLFAAFAAQPLLQGGAARVLRLPDDVLGDLQDYLDRPPAQESRQRADWVNEAELVLIGAALAMLLYFIIYNITNAVPPESGAQLWTLLTLKSIAAGVLFVAGVLGYLIWRKEAGFAVAVPLALTLVLCLNLTAMASSIADDKPRQFYQKGATWMRDNIPAGERIFNTDWDDFPRLFFFDPQHTYVSGLDPTYLYTQNPELSKLYEDITLGRTENPAPIIRERFGANYVFSDNEDVHDAFFEQARKSDAFETVYQDDDCTILKIRE